MRYDGLLFNRSEVIHPIAIGWGSPIVHCMQMIHRLLAAAVLTLVVSGATAQTISSKLRFTFRGTCYQTNGPGDIVATPITEQTLLEDRARLGGITDFSTVAIVYHFNADAKGDTVEIVRASDGQSLALEFGFWFGNDASLGRSTLTNAAQNEIRSVDYVYTLENSTYTSWNSHSMGAAFITRRFLKDTNGNVRVTAEGPIQWSVNPTANSSTKVISGTFSTGAPMF